MKKIIYWLLLIYLAASCTSTGQAVTLPPANNTLRLLTYGLQHPLYQNAQNSVAAGYGFQYHIVAGCVVSRELVDSVEKENAVVKAGLEARYGAGFWERFEKEVEQEFKNRQKVEQYLLEHPVIRAKREELEGKGSGLYFQLSRTGDKTAYEVIAHGPVSLRNEESFITRYFRLKVDDRTGQVQVIDDREAEQNRESD